MTHRPRLDLAGPERGLVEELLELAPRGLARAVLGDTLELAQTVRLTSGPGGVVARAEGRNLRYAAMAALGLDRLPEADQRRVLKGRTASDVVHQAAEGARHDPDPGAVALTVWAAAEVVGEEVAALADRLRDWGREGRALPTVDVAWMLTAAVALHARGLGGPVAEEIVERASTLLLSERGEEGLYPHVLPAAGQSRWRSHVGSLRRPGLPAPGAGAGLRCVRPQRVLLRAAEHHRGPTVRPAGRGRAVVVALRRAQRRRRRALPRLQRPPARDGTDGPPRPPRGRWPRPPRLRGLRTVLAEHPPRGPRRAGLAALAASSGARSGGASRPRPLGPSVPSRPPSDPGSRCPGSTGCSRPVRIDHECRPYELGWMLYAWRPKEIR